MSSAFQKFIFECPRSLSQIIGYFFLHFPTDSAIISITAFSQNRIEKEIEK